MKIMFSAQPGSVGEAQIVVRQNRHSRASWKLITSVTRHL